MARKRGDGKRGVYWDAQKEGYVVHYHDQFGIRRREFVGNSESRASSIAKKRRQTVKELRLTGATDPSSKPTERPTLLDVMKDVLKESKATKRSWRDDVRYALYWGEAFPDRRLDEITTADVQEWRQRRLAGEKVAEAADDRAVEPATINRAVAFLRRVYNVAIEAQLCENNPARVKKLQENNSRTRFLSLENEAALRKPFPAAKWHFVKLAIETGLRKEEQMTLRWENVDFSTATITIERSKHGEKRHVPMSDAVAEILRQRQKTVKGPWVYPNDDGTGHVAIHSHVRKVFESAVKDAELGDFVWHDLRHTFASRLVMAGVELRTVADLLGHKTLAMVMRYSHLAPEHRLNAVQRMSTMFNPTPKKASAGAKSATKGAARRGVGKPRKRGGVAESGLQPPPA